MNHEEIKNILIKTEIFSELPENILEEISTSAHYHQLTKNQLLIKEGTFSKHIYIIVSGQFSIYKLGTDDENVQAEIAILNPYAVVGEISFLDDLPRSTNVKALSDDCSVIEIPNKKLANAPGSFYKKMSKLLTNHIRAGNSAIIQHLKLKIEQKNHLINMGHFITYVLLLLSVYNLAIKSFVSLANYPYTKMYASTAVILLSTICLSIMIKHMGYSLRGCGVNFNNWQISLKESLISTAFFLVGMTVLKWIVMQTTNFSESKSVIDFQDVIPTQNITTFEFYFWLISGILVYAIFSILQEFIARGVIQGTLEKFFDFENKTILANVITSAVFASMHMHLSPLFAFLVFIPSLLWGWLYSRQHTLVGPVVSHVLIGAWAIFGLGIQDLLSQNRPC